ncbi:MAG TPA: DUF4124 domain-containing protein [Cellvibrionaceae bacterium]|nr:DUF4124 domain-containing protein [Cellvibrionaceae bacterium]
MKRLQMLLVLTLCAVGVQAEIYKIKDAKGNVTFTDTPGDKPAETVNLRPTMIAPSEPEAANTPPVTTSIIEPGAPAEEAQPAKNSLYKAKILSPKEGAEITAEQRDLAVAVTVSPGLGETDEFQLTIDGQPYGETTRGNSFVIREVPRGEHNIRVNIVSLEGKVLASSESVRVFVLRTGVNSPARK